MKKKSKKKHTYSAPQVTKIGRLEKLTQAKGGSKSDGAAKPSTRVNGSPA